MKHQEPKGLLYDNDSLIVVNNTESGYCSRFDSSYLNLLFISDERVYYQRNSEMKFSRQDTLTMLKKKVISVPLQSPQTSVFLL